MNHKKLDQTHKHLTFVFTALVFAIIMVIGIVFLVANYLSESRNQKNEISTQIKMLALGIESGDSFFTKYSRQRAVDEIRKFRPGDMRGESFFGSKLSFFVLDSSNNLVFREIIEEPRFDEVNYESKRIYKDNQTYILSKEIKDYRVVFYQNIRYGIDDMGEDLLLLLALAILLSGAVYFVGHRFVEKALVPVENNLQDMTDFVHNAGHELKTPLAVMRGNLQIMQAEEKYDKKLLKKSIGEIDNTNSLLEGLIELSQVGSVSEKVNIALATEVKKVVDELESLAKGKDVVVDNKVSGPFVLHVNNQELHILLMNLIKNAIKYNKKGGEVSLILSKNVLTIKDTGIGIKKEEHEKIFDRFYQSSTVRSKEGYGIGLSLVKKIADANNWKIELQSKQGKGSEFRIIF